MTASVSKAGQFDSGLKLLHRLCRSAETEDPNTNPYSAVPMEELKDRLELTIRGEDYKSAASIRDEIK